MKINLNRGLAICSIGSLLVFGALPFAEAAERDSAFEIGLGLVSTPEQNDVIERTYSDYSMSGGGSMLNVELGYSIALGHAISIVPKFNYIAYVAEFVNSNFPGASSSRSNTFFLSGMALRFNVDAGGGHFFVSGYAGNNSASSDFSRINALRENGNVTGFSVGYVFKSFQLEVGTMKIPVIIETDSVPSSEADFGGTFFTLKRVF